MLDEAECSIFTEMAGVEDTGNVETKKKVADNFLWSFGLFFQVFFPSRHQQENKQRQQTEKQRAYASAS